MSLFLNLNKADVKRISLCTLFLLFSLSIFSKTKGNAIPPLLSPPLLTFPLTMSSSLSLSSFSKKLCHSPPHDFTPLISSLHHAFHHTLHPLPKFASIPSFSAAPILISLWATWCTPCLEEIPHLFHWSRQNHVSLYLINVDPKPFDHRIFLINILKKHPLTSSHPLPFSAQSPSFFLPLSQRSTFLNRFHLNQGTLPLHLWLVSSPAQKDRNTSDLESKKQVDQTPHPIVPLVVPQAIPIPAPSSLILESPHLHTWKGCVFEGSLF